MRPVRERGVRLRCGVCSRVLDRMERFGGALNLLGPGGGEGEERILMDVVGTNGLAYRCRCGARHACSLASLRRAAEHAVSQGLPDIYAGRRGYGVL